MIEAPLLVRRVSEGEPEPFVEQMTKNISLAGICFETSEGRYAVNDLLTASVSIPEPQRRNFPFTRLAGRTRVVRVDPLPQQDAGVPRRCGVALEFGDDLIALTATPLRG